MFAQEKYFITMEAKQKDFVVVDVLSGQDEHWLENISVGAHPLKFTPEWDVN